MTPFYIMKKQLKTKKQRAFDKAQVTKLAKEQAVPALTVLHNIHESLRDCDGDWRYINLGTLMELLAYPKGRLHLALDEMKKDYVTSEGYEYGATNVEYYQKEAVK